VQQPDNPYVPVNAPAIGDLFQSFRFDHDHRHDDDDDDHGHGHGHDSKDDDDAPGSKGMMPF
jgi:phospholipase C